MDPQDRIQALCEDRSHGASEITARALGPLQALADEAEDPLNAVADAGARLIRAHPAMAPLVNLVDAALDRLEQDPGSAFEELAAERERRAHALATAGAKRVPGGGEVATYSRSGTVLSALRRALESGTRFRVLTSEARPGHEGLSVARELAEAGVRVTLTTDAGLASLIGPADVLLVGADALCARGLVNKVGTGALVRQARVEDVPAYVLAGTDKLLPSSHRKRPPLTAHQSMGHPLPERVHEASPLFECASLSPVEAVITEEGALAPEEIHDRLGERRLHPKLRERL